MSNPSSPYYKIGVPSDAQKTFAELLSEVTTTTEQAITEIGEARDEVAGYAGQAQAAAVTATSAATSASSSASAAALAETNAASSATAAIDAAATATTAAANIADSTSIAQAAATTASSSAIAAADSADEASDHADAAASSASAAATSAAAAANSASQAATSASNAANSASQASTSASNAQGYATAASTSATNASNSASTAATKASEASASATAAANSASQADTKAIAAANSAAAAANSASEASNFADAAADSAALAATFDPNNFVAKAGDTMGGNLTISKATPALILDTPEVSTRYIDFRTNGSIRWRIQAFNEAEEGGNKGSNFYLSRYSDSGTSLGNVLRVERDTGLVTFLGTAIPRVPATNPTNDNEVTRKAYVDAQRDTRVAKSGDTMSGALTAPRYNIDPNAYFTLNAQGNTVLGFDAVDYMLYNRSTDTLSLSVGGTPSQQWAPNGITFNKPITVPNGGLLVKKGTEPNEGGEIVLEKPASSTSLSGDVVLDVFENNVRIFEGAGGFRGAYIDITECDIQSKIWHDGNFNPASKAPIPIGGSGLGQWVTLYASPGNPCILPAGGTWAYNIRGILASNGTQVGLFLSGVLAGGSQAAGVNEGIYWEGFAWRIA